MVPILQSLNTMTNRAMFWGKQHSPQIAIGTGITLGLVGMVLACISTAKETEIIGEAEAELDAIKDTLETHEDYTEEEAKADERRVYLHAAGKTIINYAAPAISEVASVLLILKGAKILNDRYLITASSLASALFDFREYRKRTIEKYGEEVDRELRFGTTPIEIKEKIIGDDGKTKTVKKELQAISDGSKIIKHDYSRIFDSSNPFWDEDPAVNVFFVNSQQYYFNEKLRVEHHVFLNDVLIALGFAPTRAGQEVGWNYNPNNPDIDNYIDFSMFETRLENGCTVIMLDFNVDGSIINNVKWRAE